MHIAAEHTAQFRHIGEYARKFFKVHAVHTQGHIVERIARFTVYFQSRAVVGQQVDVGLYALVLAQVDVVLFVYRKVAVSQNRVFGIEVHIGSLVGQFGA